MPQIYLEYTTNLGIKNDFTNLFTQIHKKIVKISKTDIDKCKSRAINRDIFSIGDSGDENAFVHLEIGWIKGRSTEIKSQLANEIMVLLKSFFGDQRSIFKTQFTIRFVDFEKYDYFKESRINS
jgi:5-carboxymethyl-2-hydroxymuconate isomerase